MAVLLRVVIADDEPAYRNALQKTVGLMPECELVGVCKDGEEALALCKKNDVDVVLTDINMPNMNGIELVAALAALKPEIRCVILTIFEDDDNIFDAFRAGALGYLLKTSTANEVVDGIRCAHRGEAKITPKVATRLIGEWRSGGHRSSEDDGEVYSLSDRESEILDLIAKGLRNKDIAEQLGIAEKTVKNHVSNILKALQVNSRTEAAMKAVRTKMLDPD